MTFFGNSLPLPPAALRRTGPGHSQDPCDIANVADLSKLYESIVCYMDTPDPKDRGSGVLIGPAMVLTCAHVLRSAQDAANAHAYFTSLIHKDPRGTNFFFGMDKTELDPDTFFKKGSGCDYVVVAVRPEEAMANRRKPCSIFASPRSPEKDDKVHVMHYPEEPTGPLKATFKAGSGRIIEVDCKSKIFWHDAFTKGGSSGGAIVDCEGKLIGLHRAGRFFDVQPPFGNKQQVADGGYAVLVSKIASDMEQHKGTIENWRNGSYPAVSSSHPNRNTSSAMDVSAAILKTNKVSKKALPKFGSGLAKQIFHFLLILGQNSVSRELIASNFDGYNSRPIDDALRDLKGSSMVLLEGGEYRIPSRVLKDLCEPLGPDKLGDLACQACVFLHRQAKNKSIRIEDLHSHIKFVLEGLNERNQWDMVNFELVDELMKTLEEY